MDKKQLEEGLKLLEGLSTLDMQPETRKFMEDVKKHLNVMIGREEEHTTKEQKCEHCGEAHSTNNADINIIVKPNKPAIISVQGNQPSIMATLEKITRTIFSSMELDTEDVSFYCKTLLDNYMEGGK